MLYANPLNCWEVLEIRLSAAKLYILDIDIKKVQRLSRNRVHYKLMVVEVGDILMDEDIVQTVCIYKDTEVH